MSLGYSNMFRVSTLFAPNPLTLEDFRQVKRVDVDVLIYGDVFVLFTCSLSINIKIYVYSDYIFNSIGQDVTSIHLSPTPQLPDELRLHAYNGPRLQQSCPF